MKVFTCESESVIAQCIPFSIPKVKIYKHLDVPCDSVEGIASDLKRLIEKVYTSLLVFVNVEILVCVIAPSTVSLDEK